MTKKSVLPKDNAAEYALRALAAALDAQPVELEATAAGEKPLAATLKNFIAAFLKVQSSERQLIESVAHHAGVRVEAFDRATPRKDPLAARFPVPLVRVTSSSSHGLTSTLFMLGNGYIATWFGPADGSNKGTPLRPLGIGVTGNTVHATAINSLSGMLKEFIRVHKQDVAHTQPHQNATPAGNAQHAPVPAGAIQHDRHGDAAPDVPNTPGLMDVKGGRFVEPGHTPAPKPAPEHGTVPGLMSVRHGQLVHSSVATASSPTTVGAYVQAQAESLGMGAKQVKYVLNNLAIAKVSSEAVASDLFQGLADRALQSLAKKLKKDKDAEEKQKVDLEANRPTKRPFGTNDAMLEEHKDPFTGEKLRKVYLLGGVEALMNEHSKVVYPIPDLKKVEGEDKA